MTVDRDQGRADTAEVLGERLVLDGIKVDFGTGRPAVDIDRLEVEPGEFVCLVGPSGCGKTTTMRVIAGLMSPTEGSITVGDRRIDGLPVQKRNVGMVFQNYALYPNMTVRRNVDYSLRKRGDGKASRARRVDELAALLNLGHLLDRRPKELSGGEQQRVALGRALAKNPSLFLLDEPLSNLDAKLRNQMRRELVKLHRLVRSTVIYVTHDQLEAMTMSSRIAVMSGGIVQQFDSPDVVYSRPANRFVAGFIGSPAMNFVDGELSTGEAGVMIKAALGEVVPSARIQAALASAAATAGRRVVIGVRPEHVLIGAAAAGAAQKAKVTLVENVGSELLISLSDGDCDLMARTAPGELIQVGQSIPYSFDPDHLHVFGEDEKALT